MRGPGNGNGISCARGAIRHEIASLFGSDISDRRRDGRRSLRIEPLESRQMMAVAATTISSIWFAVVSNNTETEHAAAASWTAQDTVVAATNASTTAASTNTDSTLCDWIVQFDTNSLDGIASVADTASLLAGCGIDFEVLRGLGLTGMVLVRSSGASISEVESYLARNASVADYEQDAYHAADTASSSTSTFSEWDSTAIDLKKANAITTGSTSVVVAVIDTGVDYTHNALDSNIWINPGEVAGNGIDDDGNGFVDDIYGYDFANNDSNPMDDNGHGTHVSGTIISTANCSVMCLKFLDSDGSGYLSNAIAAVNYATMMRSLYGVNVRVDNNSWGGGSFSSAMQSAITAAGDAGILFVAAAGNDGTNNDTTAEYPANYTSPNVISVAASTKTNALADFSNYGATTVDIAAPGVSIVSTTPGNTYSTYSGTSMATPHVSAVAALAWAVCPDASVADVRDAILDGAASVSSLKGKVAAGGVLNAYNTLNLLVHSGVDTAPVVGSLSLSTGSVSAGASVTLTANNITATTGTIDAVRFVLDTNGNGQYDNSDTVLGTSTTVSGCTSSLKIGTAGYASGTYTILAAAKNSAGDWSAWVATTLTVLPSDDHGGNAAVATSVGGVASSTSGRIGENGDADWFSFTATAGKTYVFTVALGTLADSSLYLYGTNGTTQLAMNDDYGTSCASRITWTATADGVYYLKVVGYGTETGTYTLGVSRQNAAPVLATVGSQTMSYSQTTLTIALKATDADGDALTYTATVTAIDSTAQKAYNLDQSLNLHRYSNGSYYQNARGLNERYLLGNKNTLYYILPSGALYRLNGSIAKSVYIDTLSATYYSDPSLLYAATKPSLTEVDEACVSVTVSGNTLTITRASNYTGGICVTVGVSDGVASDSETFTLSDPLASKAYSLDQSLGLHAFVSGSYYPNARGRNEKYMLGPNNVMYYLMPNGSLYRFNGSLAKSTLVAKLSAAYYANPKLLHESYSPSLVAAAASAANKSSSLAFVEDGLRNARSGIDAETSAGKSLDAAGMAMAWLAMDAGISSGGESILENAVATTLATETTVAGRLTASLHDEVLAQYAPSGVFDASARREISPAALSKAFSSRLTPERADRGNEIDADEFGLGIGGSADLSLIDRVFDLSAEALLPSAGCLA